jgi:hypothetical protein
MSAPPNNQPGAWIHDSMSAQAEEILRALSDLAEESPAEIRTLAGEILKTLTQKEIAILIAWRDGCRGNEPEHGGINVIFNAEIVTSEFTRKSRQTLKSFAKRKR